MTAYRSFAAICLALVLFAANLSAQDMKGAVPLPGEKYSRAYDLLKTEAQVQNNTSERWAAFKQEHGEWFAYWNEFTHTPARLWGEGYQVPGVTVVTQENVETVSRQALAKFSEILRVDAAQLQLSNVRNYLGQWTVRFQQVYNGVPVLFSDVALHISDGGRVSMMGSDFQPELSVSVTPDITEEQARSAALVGLDQSSVDDAQFSDSRLVVLPYKLLTGVSYHLCYEMEVTTGPMERWHTLVDAAGGTVLWRSNRVRDGITGHVTATIRANNITQSPSTVDISGQWMNVANQNFTTNAAGMFSATTSGQVIARLRGSFVSVERQDAASAQVTANVSNNGTYNVHWDQSNSHAAERTTFFSVMRAYSFIKGMDSSFTGLDYQMPATVNGNGTCNAFWDGTGVNFLKGSTSPSNPCANTGEMAEVIMHEYGHGINDKVYIENGQSIGMTNPSLHEGLADVNPALILDTPAMGVGFFGGSAPLRNLDNTAKYPDDVSGDSHITGLIIGGAVWDMREAIGLAQSRKITHFAKHAVPDDVTVAGAFTKYFVEVLIADDDDANLANGTPNSAAIIPAFVAHGIPALPLLTITHTPITTANVGIAVAMNAALQPGFPQIIANSMKLHYRVRGGTWTSANMNMVSGAVGAVSNWTGGIPAQMGGVIMEYYFEAMDGFGTKSLLPAAGDQNPFVILIGFKTLSLYDFEQNQGWTTNVSGDNAQKGVWVNEDPVGTISSGEQVQPEDDHTLVGTKCWVTGNASAGAAPGTNDVDNGVTTLQSPTFSVVNRTLPVITYWRWFSNDLGASPGGDPWVVQISNDGGNSWTSVENTTQSFNYWSAKLLVISDYVTPGANMRLRFIARDLDPQSLVEAAVDDVEILYVDPVPVELALLSASRRDRTIDVVWKTATETNNYGFDVEYKTTPDGDWATAGFVAGKGTTSDEQNYSFTFSEPSGATVYVRLKQMDFDGSHSYSPVVQANAEGIAGFTLHQNYPNPFNPNTTITFDLDRPAPVTLEILNRYGGLVKTFDLGDKPAGGHAYNLDMTTFPSGLYYYRLNANGRTATRSMMLVK